MEDIGHWIKRAGLMLTRSGLITLAVLLTVTTGGLLEASLAPLIGLPIALAMSSYITLDESHYRKQKIRNAYRHEIAETLGLDPKQVTSEVDLPRAAEKNPVLKEQLTKIDTHRNFSLLASALAVGAAVLLVFLPGWEQLTVAAGNMLESYGLNFINGHQAVAAGVMTAAASFAIDRVIEVGGHYAFGMDRKTTYERIQDLKGRMLHDETLTPEQVMGVFVSANRGLAAAIQQSTGKAYDDLPGEAQSKIVARFEGQLGLSALTAAINRGEISPNELAYAAVGQRSGKPQKPPRSVEDDGRSAAPEISPVRQQPRAVGSEITGSHVAAVPTQEARQKTSHVARYLAEMHATGPADMRVAGS